MQTKLFMSALAALSFSALSSQAASLFISTNCGGFTESLTTAQGGISNSTADSNCGGRAEARAGPGYMGVNAFTANTPQTPGQGTTRASVSESWQFSITAPTNHAGGPIDVQVRFDFDGSVGGISDTNATNNSVRSASLEMLYNLSGGPTLAASDSRRLTQSYSASEYDNNNGAGFAFAGPTAAVTSRVISMLPTSTLTVGLTLNAVASIFSPDNPQVQAGANGLNTLSFASDGPAFILPDGFFINSTEANIVNNYWIDPRSPPVATVPLPASLPLLAFGGLGLALIGRVRRRRKNLKIGSSF